MKKLSVFVAWATLVALATVAPQVASPAYATAPLIPDTGFEDGTTDGWTSSSGSLVAFNASIENEGQGGGIISSAATFDHPARSAQGCEVADIVAGDPGWSFQPASAGKAGALQPKRDEATFVEAREALGLDADEQNAITTLLDTQKTNSGCGGNATPQNAAWLKKTVSLTADTEYQMWWNYLGTDYVPFNDGSLTSLVSAEAETADATIDVNRQGAGNRYALLGFTNPGTGDYSTGSYGATGWQFSTYEVSVTGDYVLGFAAFNLGDTSLSPLLLIDDARGTTTKNGTAFTPVASNRAGAPSLTPSAPTITSTAGAMTVPSSGQLAIAFTAPSNNGEAVISNYQYSTDGGKTYRALDPASTSSPITISKLSSDGSTNLEDGKYYPIAIKAVNSYGAGLASNSVASAFTAPGSPTISSVVAGSGQLQVNFTAPASNGGKDITNYQYSTDGTNYVALDPISTSSPITISKLSSDGTTALANGTSYPITLKAVNSEGAGVASSSTSGTPVAPSSSGGGSGQSAAPSPVIPVAPTVQRQVTLPPEAVLGPVEAPVLRNNQLPAPPAAPQSFVNGVPTQLQTEIVGPTDLSLRTDVVDIAMSVQLEEGLVGQGTSGETEVQLRSGGVLGIQGSGLAPRSFAQIFMPLKGTNARELARIEVDDSGSFDGEALFQTSLQDDPLPIGRQTLQMVAVDEQGRQNVLEITVNIAQPPPAPAISRQDGEIPDLRPGQSLATNAGVPEVVDVTVIEEQKQTVIEGAGWLMSVVPEDENSSVVEVEDGEVLLELVRDETVTVAGSGFLPGTRADVWLFSEPTLLGTVDIGEDGSFSGQVNVDGRLVSVGEHTLQLQGVGSDGYVRAANLGVLVNDTSADVTTEEAAAGFLWWLWLLVIPVALLVWWVIARYRRRSREA